MPIYEYLCKDCGSHFDTLRPMKDADVPVICLDCHGEHTIRQLSLFVSKSGERITTASSGGGCGQCSGGSCGSCHH